MFLNSLHDFLEYDFLLIATLTIILLSVVMGALSPIVVAKKYSFIGSAISHSTLLGLALAMVLDIPKASVYFYLITFLTTLVFAMALAKASFEKTLPADSLIGTFFTATMSAGMLLQSLTNNRSANLFNYLFGDVLLVDSLDIYLLIFFTAGIVFHLSKNFNSWISFCWNEEMAALNQVSRSFYHYLLFTLITLAIVLGLKIAGIILVSSFLIIPGAFALKVGHNVKSVFIISICFALFTSFISLLLSNALNVSVGPMIAVVQASFFALTYFRRMR